MQSGLLINDYLGATVVTFQEASVIDGVVVEAIGRELYALVDLKDKKKIILDFTAVKFLSSSMLGVLMLLHRKAGAIHARVVLCGLRDEIMKVFKIMKLDKVLEFARDEESALKALDVHPPKS